MKIHECKSCCKPDDMMPLFGEAGRPRICSRYNKRIDEIKNCDIYQQATAKSEEKSA